jgi:hypothetical protein
VIRGQQLVVGTEVGAFLAPRPTLTQAVAARVSAAGSSQQASWQNLGSGLPPVTVWDLTLAPDGRVVAGTHGRGTWEVAPTS